MKLCFISDPNSIHTRRWVNWFHQRGHSVRVVADIPLREAWPGIEVIDLTKSINAPIIRFPVWAFMLKQSLDKWQADVLHAHRVNSAGWVGAMSGFQPLVVTPWGSDLFTLHTQPRIFKTLAAMVVRRANLVTAGSQELLLQAQKLGAAPDRCQPILWGVDSSTYYPGKSPELRQQLEIGDGPVLLSPRATRSIYNIHVLIAAMPSVLEKFPQLTLVLRDYNTDPGYKARLVEQIATLRIERSVRWLGRITPWEGNAASYRMADIAVSVPSSDSMAISIWEAMACGVPVIASDLPSLREWIRPGENGLLVPAGDADALAEAIILLLSDIELRKRFSQAGIELSRKNADQQVEMAKMEQLYMGLIGEKHNV